MRKGGGQAKGAAFERKVCFDLSMWVSGGGRTDLFVRNVMSGGRYTVAIKRDEDHGTPGDLMAGHPSAFAFASLFQVECKSYRNLNWTGFLYDYEKSFLGKVISICEEQGKRSGQHFMVIAKQNQRDPMVIMRADVGHQAILGAWISPNFHELHGGRFIVMPLHDMTMYISARKFLAAVGKLAK